MKYEIIVDFNGYGKQTYEVGCLEIAYTVTLRAISMGYTVDMISCETGEVLVSNDKLLCGDRPLYMSSTGL